MSVANTPLLCGHRPGLCREGDSDEDEDDDDLTMRRARKPIPEWAQPALLRVFLEKQRHMDPDKVHMCGLACVCGRMQGCLHACTYAWPCSKGSAPVPNVVQLREAHAYGPPGKACAC